MVRSLPLRGMLEGISTRSGASFAVQLPDGTRVAVGADAPAFTLCIHTDTALFGIATRGHIGLMEAYFAQEVDVDGDFAAALATGMASGFDQQPGALNNIENGLHDLRHSNRDPATAKANACFHCGLGVDFYRQWLDPPHLRLLGRRHAQPGAGATQQDRPRLPQDQTRSRRRLAIGRRSRNRFEVFLAKPSGAPCRAVALASKAASSRRRRAACAWASFGIQVGAGHRIAVARDIAPC